VTFLPQSVIATKRDGERLSPAAIVEFVSGVAAGTVSEGQVAAFAMAIYLRGLDLAERVALTEAMRDSGSVLAWDDLPGPVVDKHSTGGVGDCVSLLLAPAIAACGAYVPMLSGRGLGHTGGTLDKLDAIPGYRSRVPLAAFQAAVRDAGCAIVGPTADLAPADGRIYAVRDVTATVDCADLIIPSILSKKLAAGVPALVLDVKAGSGAFMRSLAEAEALAQGLVHVAAGAGVATTALVTDMSGPLAPAAGNALETRLAIDVLAGRRSAPRLLEVTAALGAEMLVLTGLAADFAHGAERVRRAIASGAAAERFQRMVAALGGPADIVDDPGRHLAVAPIVHPVPAPIDGVVTAVDLRRVGHAVIALGGGRRRPEDEIDPAVGVTGLAGIGDRVGPGRPLAFVHAASESGAEAAARMVAAAYWVTQDGTEAAEPRFPILGRIHEGPHRRR